MWLASTEFIINFVRETTEDGKELVFDHGAPYFTATNADVHRVVADWEARGFVAEWKESFGSFNFISRTFSDYEKVFPASLLYLCFLNSFIIIYQ